MKKIWKNLIVGVAEVGIGALAGFGAQKLLDWRYPDPFETDLVIGDGVDDEDLREDPPED